MRMGVIGVGGRMGRLLAEEIVAAGHELAGGTTGKSTSPPDTIGIHILPDLPTLAAASDVVIDFTIAHTAATHAETLARLGTPWVLGTSGLSVTDEEAVAAASGSIPIVYSANFSPGVTILLELARRMGQALGPDAYDAEIVEMHHRQKVDAPSGTALAIGRAVAAGRGVDFAEVMESGRDGHTGPRRTGAIGFAALRGGQVVGEHTLIFAGASEHIALTHRAFDRRVFATGAVRAAAWLAGRAPGVYSMSDVMASAVMASDVMASDILA